MAISAKVRGTDQVAVAFFGDGATNHGAFHEAVNFGSIQDAPVIFVCENNLYATATPLTMTTRNTDIASKAAAYGIPGVRVDGFDVLAVYAEAVRAVERARSGKGPTLLVTESYRFEGHYAGEPEVYRTREEVREYRKKDPIPRFRKYLVENGITKESELERIDRKVRQEIVDAVRFAKESPEPDPGTAMDYIYAESTE